MDSTHDDNFDLDAAEAIGEFRQPDPLLDEFFAAGLDPTQSTAAPPGTEEKVLMLSARYAAGVALWNTHDRHGHGLRECELMGAILGIGQQP